MMQFLRRIYSRKIILITALIALLPLGYGTYFAISRFYNITAPLLLTPPTEVKGSKVSLRLLKEEYYLNYHHMFSPLVRKSLEFPEHITLGYTIQYLQGEHKKVSAGKMLQYCIFDNIDNKLIGSIEIREKNETDPGQLGCWVNEAYWGGGRFQEALNLISKTYFRLKPLEKSYIAHVRLWNQRSYHALKKYGFDEIGYYYENGKATRYIMELKRTK
jgi:RimJ/RimL family protein N-acetyltransferase